MADGVVSVEKPKHPGGRPPDYRPEFCDRIIELGKLGYSQAQMAAELDVAKCTITYWAKVHPEFLNALERARTYSQSWWEMKAQSGLESRDFNAALWDKSVKSRFREDYTDRTINELVGKDDGAIEFKDNGADARKVAFMLGRAVGRAEKAKAEQSDSTK
jgi:transposase